MIRSLILIMFLYCNIFGMVRHSALSRLTALPCDVQNIIKEMLIEHYSDLFVLSTQSNKICDGRVTLAALSYDGKFALFAAGRRLLQYTQHDRIFQEIQPQADDDFTCMHLIPNGTLALTGSRGESSATLWHFSSGKKAWVASLEGHELGITTVYINPSGTCALTGSQDGTARFWDLRTLFKTNSELLDQSYVLRGPSGFITTACLAEESMRALTGSADGTVILWDLTNLDAIQPYPLVGHTQEIRSIALTCNGNLALTGSNDGTVRL